MAGALVHLDNEVGKRLIRVWVDMRILVEDLREYDVIYEDFQNLAENDVIYGENDTKDLIFNYSTRIGMCRNFYDRRNFWLKKFGYDRGVSGGL